MDFEIRRATNTDAKDIAKILGLGVKVDMPFLPVLHTEEEDLNYTKNTILKNYDVWVGVNEKDEPVGFIAFQDGWIHQLFILKDYQYKGIGSALLQKAMDSYDKLQVWTFQKSTQAREFYEKKGFKVEKFTDGADNDEQEPDVYYTWEKGN